MKITETQIRQVIKEEINKKDKYLIMNVTSI